MRSMASGMSLCLRFAFRMGLKLRRYRQWLEVVREEGRELSWLDVAIALLKGALVAFRNGARERELWRSRVRICYRCPVYDRGMRRCRPYTGSPLGCGCWVPLIALFKDRCWGDEVLSEEGIGWEFWRSSARRNTGSHQATS